MNIMESSGNGQEESNGASLPEDSGSAAGGV